MEVGLGPGDFVLDGDPDTPPKIKGHSPNFLAHVYCGQTAGWIKMPLGTDVGLGPGHTVLDGDPAPNLILFFYSPTHSLTIHLFIALMHFAVKILLTHPAVRNLHELVLSRFHTFVLHYHPVIMFGEIICSEDRGSNNL